MTLQQVMVFGQSRQKRNAFVLKALFLLVLITVWIDYFFSRVQSTSFYLSESLLFGTTYWLLFLPLLNLQWKITLTRPMQGFLYAVLATATHLLAYPALVWLVSQCFYGHTFPYGQTLGYGLTTYFIKTLLIYGLSVPVIGLVRRTLLSGNPAPAERSQADLLPKEPEEGLFLLVPDVNNTKIRVKSTDILYFSANSPYINVYHQVKKYLLTETLKSLEQKLPPDHFVRIHKSCIVNVEKVISCRSRLNGDYDLELCDGTVLRLSRNYSASFKTRFNRHTPV